ncbi:MAG: hypothetical protein JRN08_03595 [Nitrososphaerota archaeon]|nr:hypothetical protein [Nitrososphaerota archaeon]
MNAGPRDGRVPRAEKRSEARPIASLRGVKHRLFPFYYSPGKKLYHVVVKLSDSPGSYSSILDLLSTRVNLIGTSTYSLSDGAAIFSGFAEALSPKETREGIERLIRGSKAAIEVKVNEGKEGVLIDTLHTGFTVEGEDFVLMRREGLGEMFDRVTKILGSGGDALLYEQGAAMGRSAVETLTGRLGARVVESNLSAVYRVMSAQGLGEIRGEMGPKDGSFLMTVRDCFECSEGAPRGGCNFMRGYFVGAAEGIFRRKYAAQEVKCVLKGYSHCEFTLVPES